MGLSDRIPNVPCGNVFTDVTYKNIDSSQQTHRRIWENSWFAFVVKFSSEHTQYCLLIENGHLTINERCSINSYAFQSLRVLEKMYEPRRYWVRLLLRNRDTHGIFRYHILLSRRIPENHKDGEELIRSPPDFRERKTKRSNRPSICNLQPQIK